MGPLEKKNVKKDRKKKEKKMKVVPVPATTPAGEYITEGLHVKI